MKLLDNLLGVLAPSTCLICGREGSPICADCTSVNLMPYGARCYNCGRLSPASKTCSRCARLGGPRSLWISYVYDGAAERLIDAYKFNSARPAGELMAKFMAQNLPEPGARINYLVVPVPSSSGRVRERGFDHATLLAKNLARNAGWQFAPLLRRHGQSRQVGANRAQRFRQALANYSLRPAATNKVRGQAVLLVDDVVTTGATMQACARLLRTAGAARIDGVAFAKRI